MNKTRTISIITSIFAGLMFLGSLASLFVRYFAPDSGGLEIVMLAANAFLLAVMAVLFIQNRIYSKGSQKNGILRIDYFALMLFIMCIKIASDSLAYITLGYPQFNALSWILCTVTYMCGLPILMIFWVYIAETLDVNERKRKIVGRLLGAISIIMVILYLTNPLTKILFVIDEKGSFYLAPTYWIMTIGNVVGAVICSYETLRSDMNKATKVLVVFVFSAPIVGIVLGVINADLIFLQYLFLTVAVFACYLQIYIKGQDEYQAKIKELNMATAIQRKALRDDFGRFKDHKIHAYMKPAREVGGDFYDFFDIDDHTTGVLIADVSGKGIPAAVFMMQGLTAIRELAQMGCPINEVFEKANDLLCKHNVNELFITAWMAYIDRNTGKVIYVNAGHNSPILKKADGAAEYITCKPSMVLAAMEGMPYKVHELEIEPGDNIFMYTDGIPEAQTVDNELYGDERLIICAGKSVSDPEKLTITVLEDVNSFVGQAEQFDDMTIIAYERD